MNFLLNSRLLNFLAYLVLFPLSLSANSWTEDCDVFISQNLVTLRNTRPELKRPEFSFDAAVKILTFINDGKDTYGASEIAKSNHIAELLVDMCDIVNLQHPDFKKRYDIFVEQWEGKDIQLPFSLFTFDRVAQIFHYHERLFHVADGTAYRKILEQIIIEELPVLRDSFILIQNCDEKKPECVGLNADLDKLPTAPSGTDKDKTKKEIRKKHPPIKLKNLYTLSSMAHDYLTLGRIEEAVDIVATIPSFTKPEQREAFLAAIIQIGELSTNKNLSRFIKKKAPTIPWDQLVHCRDAIEHQDENGFDAYFKTLVEEQSSPIDFKKWKDELLLLKKKVKEVRTKIWGANPKDVFEEWLKDELDGTPSYGKIQVIPQTTFTQGNKITKKVFRQTPLFLSNKQLWADLTLAKESITYDHLKAVKAEIERVKSLSIDDFSGMPDKQIREQAKNRQFLDCYQKLETYLWTRLKIEAIHLNDGEKDVLEDELNLHLDVLEVSNMCLALLKNDQSFLTTENKNKFMHAAALSPDRKILIMKMIQRIQPEMMITRQVAEALPFDSSKDLAQPFRRKLFKSMFGRTAEHLHTMAHGPDFEKRLWEEAYTIRIKFAFAQTIKSNPESDKIEREMSELHEEYGVPDGYGYLNLPLEHSIAFAEKVCGSAEFKKNYSDHFRSFPGEEYKRFGKKVMETFYRKAHQIHLGSAMQESPTTYLASIYSLSVGIGALKSWVIKEGNSPAPETEAAEKLRDGRNFIAHGDLLRNMSGVQLADIQASLMTEHLYNCCEM